MQKRIWMKRLVLGTLLLLIGTNLIPSNTIAEKGTIGPPLVKINLEPYSVIYEGDIINCSIMGNPTVKYWMINNKTPHTTFYNSDPVIYDPEPTPLTVDYVNLTVYGENTAGNASDTVLVKIKRIFFGDVHWHSLLSDGKYSLDHMYNNTKNDRYLDFTCSTEHTENSILNTLFIPCIWQRIKNLVEKYDNHGDFSTFVAYEYSSSQLQIDNLDFSPNIEQNHMNFYYQDAYTDAQTYSPRKYNTFSKIFKVMSDEWQRGHKNIGFIHHPLAGEIPYFFYIPTKRIHVNFYVNWSYLIHKMNDNQFRQNALNVLRGVEVYSRWGTAIGNYSTIPVLWRYSNDVLHDDKDCWVENALWEWSENNYTKGHPFVLMASSDTHKDSRAGSAPAASKNTRNPSGIIAAYAVHNTRDELWDAMNNCSIYGSQLLKIRANVRFDNQMALGQWINCSKNLSITITALSTFPGYDASGKTMKPNGYNASELNYPIQDVWLLKKDNNLGRPWCKVIGHAEPNSHLAVVTFVDDTVQPNDFYWVAIRQKGQELRLMEDEYMAFLGPVFIKNVVEDQGH